MADTPPGTGVRTVSLIVFSRDFERVHYALCVTATAAAIGDAAALLFTGGAIHALVAASDGDSDNATGWRGLPGEGGRQGGEIDADYRSRGVAGIEELFLSCAGMGVRFIACEMGLRVAGLDRAALRNDLGIEVAGLATFLADSAAGGTITFV